MLKQKYQNLIKIINQVKKIYRKKCYPMTILIKKGVIKNSKNTINYKKAI
jgi:hypothetical protein